MEKLHRKQLRIAASTTIPGGCGGEGCSFGIFSCLMQNSEKQDTFF